MADSTASTRLRKVTAGLGFALGAVMVVVALAGWRLPRGAGYAGSDVFLIAQPTGELAVAPTGAVVSTHDLSPGEQATGSFAITNQTGRALAVRMRVLPDRNALDGLLQIDVRAGGQELYSGPLGGLRSWSAGSALLRVRKRALLTIRVSYPANVTSGWQGQVESVPIELKATPATGDA